MNSFSAMEVQIASIVFVIFALSLFSLFLLLFLTDTILIIVVAIIISNCSLLLFFSLFIRELHNNNVTKKKRRRRKRRIRDVEPRNVFHSFCNLKAEKEFFTRWRWEDNFLSTFHSHRNFAIRGEEEEQKAHFQIRLFDK